MVHANAYKRYYDIAFHGVKRDLHEVVRILVQEEVNVRNVAARDDEWPNWSVRVSPIWRCELVIRKFEGEVSYLAGLVDVVDD